MNNMGDAGVVAGGIGQTSYPDRLRGLAVTGFIATLAAMVAVRASSRRPHPSSVATSIVTVALAAVDELALRPVVALG